MPSPTAVKNNGHHSAPQKRSAPRQQAPGVPPAPRAQQAPPAPGHRRITTFEIHTDLPVWILDTVHDLLIMIARLTHSKIDFAIVTDSNNYTAQVTP